MKTRPRELTALALILIGIGISFPIQAVWLVGTPPSSLGEILSKLSFWNWAIIALAAILVPLTLRASPLFWFVSPAFLGAVIGSNWRAALTFHFWALHIPTLGVALVFLGVIVSPCCRKALTQPKIRWWLTPKRRKVSLNVRVCPVMGGEMNSWIVDLSDNGAFVDLRAPGWRDSRPRELTAGAYCWVRIGLNEITSLTCTAEVVRVVDAKGSYPKGAGLRFIGLTPHDKRKLHGFLRTLDGREPVQALVAAV